MKLTVKEVTENPEGYNDSVVELSRLLLAMKNSYSSMAADFSHKLFLSQDGLELTAGEVIEAQKYIANIKEVINAGADAALEIVTKNVLQGQNPT